MLDVTSAAWIKVYSLFLFEGFVFDVPERLIVSLRNERLRYFPRLKEFLETLLDLSSFLSQLTIQNLSLVLIERPAVVTYTVTNDSHKMFEVDRLLTELS